MSRAKAQNRLKKYTAAYACLRQRLSRTGFLWTGTVLRYSQPCGKPSCSCRRGRRFHHGPYYVWTRKVRGKTVTRMLSPAEGRLYRCWMMNRRKLDRTIKQMMRLSERVAPLLLEEGPGH